MYEHRSHRLAPTHRFALRFLRHLLISTAIIAISLAAGIVGYEHYERLGLRDAFLNAAMLLGGMGPIKTDLSKAGEVFAGFYALYSGLVFIVAAGVLMAPVVHRLLHTVHCDLDDSPEPRPSSQHAAQLGALAAGAARRPREHEFATWLVR